MDGKGEQPAPPAMGLKGMNEGYDQPSDPPSYSQAVPGTQPAFVGQQAAQVPYAGQQVAQGPYGVQQVAQGPYGVQQVTQGPYGGQQVAQGPYTGQHVAPVAAYPAAYPGVAPPVNITSQPTHINNVVVQGGGTTVLLQHNDYLCWSIFSCLCCFMPLGLVAIIFSIMSRDAATCGNVEVARSHARVAMWLNVASILAAVIAGIIIVVISVNNVKSEDDGY